jgi:hypothetical protein
MIRGSIAPRPSDFETVRTSFHCLQNEAKFIRYLQPKYCSHHKASISSRRRRSRCGSAMRRWLGWTFGCAELILASSMLASAMPLLDAARRWSTGTTGRGASLLGCQSPAVRVICNFGRTKPNSLTKLTTGLLEPWGRRILVSVERAPGCVPLFCSS